MSSVGNLQNLSIEAQQLIFEKVARNSAEDFIRLNLSSKTFMRMDHETNIISTVSLDEYYGRVDEMTEKRKAILRFFREREHPVALFILGLQDYCFEGRAAKGIQSLQKGYENGDKCYQYALGLCLIDFLDHQGIIYLKQLFSTISKKYIRKIRELTRAVTLDPHMPFRDHISPPCMNSIMESDNINVTLESTTPITVEQDDDCVEEIPNFEAKQKVSRKKRKKTSKVWDVFQDLGKTADGKDQVKCKYCSIVLNYDSKYGTCNLLRHCDTCLRRDTKDVKQLIMSSNNKGGMQVTSSKFDPEKLRELLFNKISATLYGLFSEYVAANASTSTSKSNACSSSASETQFEQPLSARSSRLETDRMKFLKQLSECEVLRCGASCCQAQGVNSVNLNLDVLLLNLDVLSTMFYWMLLNLDVKFGCFKFGC
ncbi:putative Zinc finger, BED-type [Corchorus capsularis]|uniref:Putative Zinc finger, BED-type n=1 Tax=Corchorus capsularis TaxID=210143 RepID=A0A1R3I7H5_COCAP|nr:putative Zinc finger, BED-type [Corchorus capsularis]